MSASFRRVVAIARTTFLEMARLRVFYVLALFALVLIVSSSFLARISFQQELQVTKDIALGAVNFFLSLLAIVATAQLLPRDIEDRVVYSVLAKPVARFEYILGKFLGVLALLLLSVIAMSVLCVAVIHLREQSALRETAAQFSPANMDDRASAVRAIEAAGVNGGLFAALGATLLKGIILAALALCISSFATSSIFTITAMAMTYLVGHLEAVAREYWLEQHAAGWLTRAFLAVIAFIFPDLQAFNLSDQLITGAAVSSALLLRLFQLGAVYTIGYLLLAIAIFYQREL
jgi:ABC-2 type transport system permease protein